MNHIVAMSSYGTYLQDKILKESKEDVKFMDIRHIVQQSAGTGSGT